MQGKICGKGHEACMCSTCATHSLAPSRVHQSRSSPIPMLLGCYKTFITQARLVINSIFSPPPFLREWGVGLKNSKLLLMASSFLRPTLPQEPSRGRLGVRRLQEFQKPFVRSWRQETDIRVDIFFSHTSPLVFLIFYSFETLLSPLYFNGTLTLLLPTALHANNFNMCLSIPS